MNYLLMPMIMSKVEYILEAWMITLPLFLIIYIVSNRSFRDNVYELYEDYFKRSPLATVKLSSENKNHSTRYQAIMWYLSYTNNPTIKKVSEVFYSKYNFKKDDYESKHFFRVNQSEYFKINENIYGHVETTSKEKQVENTKITEDVYNLILSSQKIRINKIIDFLDDISEQHKNYQLNKSMNKQLIVEVKYNKKEDDFDVNYNEWISNTTFENKFFENKQDILSSIDNFLINKELYNSRGIPYHLGIMIYGEPGCGKTSFIKSLANKTGRHIIDIKLTDNINLSEFKNIFFDDEITSDLRIPKNKRLYILEDIDVMGSIVLKREKDKDETKDKIKDKDETKDKTKNESFEKIDAEKEFGKQFMKMFNAPKKEDKTSLTNNNMSYLLNILDGLDESEGRIIIATTNHIDKIDPAVIRAGRLGDIVIEFKLANKKIVEEIINFYYNVDIELDFDIEAIPHCIVIQYCRTSKTIELVIEKLKKHKVL